MPYIKKEIRANFDTLVEQLAKDLAVNTDYEGNFNYVISAIISKVLETNGTSYREINKLVGVLECCKLELYRKVAAPYEQTKASENGEVYT